MMDSMGGTSAVVGQHGRPWTVDDRFRKQQVLGSNPSVGSSDLNREAGLRTGFFAVGTNPVQPGMWPGDHTLPSSHPIRSADHAA
jgi:hypothetical protein